MPFRRRCKPLVQSTFLKITKENKHSISYRGYRNLEKDNLISCRLTCEGHTGFLKSLIGINSNKRDFSCSANSNMRFVQFKALNGGPQRLGVQLSQDGDIIDVSGVDSTIPNGFGAATSSRPQSFGPNKKRKCTHISMEGEWKTIWLKPYSLHPTDLNINLPVIGSLVYCDDSASDHMATESGVVGESKSVVPLSQIRLLPPITSPSKVVCVGLNYSGHCDEQNVPYPKEPVSVIFRQFGVFLH
ncbi:unnamed protein product [Timema podura]|uniref:Uncharacterized protein n=1 Tax=Timema podura TaxID=61482 RepID=A0ABN7NMD0_TIMPD|nr:unnamed protein product [Timema podura]